MYSYFFTTANSCSNIKSIKCRLLKDSTTEYLVCLKSHSLDVYSLSSCSVEPNCTIENDSNYPLLVTSLNSYFTFLTFVEYRPPDHNQSHLLVLTQNYTLLLLTFDSENCKFRSKNVACLQEPFSGTRYGNIILKIDVEYNLIVFCGHSRMIKCIVLNKNNYFNFSDIISMRTNDSFFLDIEFISTEYTSENNLRSNFETESSSFSTSLNKDLQFKSPNRNSLIHYFECKLVVLGQDNNTSQNSGPERWLCGMHLFFEIEILNGYKRFNSYSNVALFGDPFKLAGPFSMFVPLRLNNNKFDSIMILGAGSVAYTSFKAPRQIKYFKLDSSITEVCCYLQYSSNKYLFADDNGNVYLMELLLAPRDCGTGLKRRVSSNINSKTVHTTKIEGEMTVQDVIVTRAGSCSIPSSIVKLNEEKIFCGSKMGNSCTITLNLNGFNTKPKINRRREWVHSNLGPITDFIYLQETYDSNSSILACCGMGSSGTFSKIYFGIGSEVLYSTKLDAVSNLFSLQLHIQHSNQPCLVLCVSFYRFSRFYLINQPDHKPLDNSSNSSFVDLFETKLSKITKLEKTELVYDETTLLFTKLSNGYILQVTPLNVLLTKADFKRVNSVEVSKLLNEANCSKFIVSSIMCLNHLLLVLSNNTLLLLDQRLNVVKTKELKMSVASVTYISENDLLKSDFRETSIFKTDGIDGLLAATGWDNTMVILSLKTMNILYRYSCNSKFGTFIKSLKFGMVGPEVYLLASVSDGKLNTYKLLLDSTGNRSASSIKIELDNIIELSDKSFNLLEVKMNDNSETCDLSCRKLITTGNKCNIIHANNNKIEYTKVNINHLSALATLSNKWYSTSNNSQSGSKSGSFLSNMDHETLVVYYSNKNLVIGVLDFVRNLNVKTILSGTNFNKIVYHYPSKLAVVSTIPQYIINPNYFNNKPNGKSNNGEEELSSENGTKKRKLDTEFDSDLSNLNRVLGHEYTHQHQNLMVCTDANESLGETNDLFSLSCLFFVDVDDNKVVHKLELPKGHIVSSLTNYSHADIDYIAVGTSLVTEENDLPVDGYLYLVEIYKNADSFTIKAQRTTTTLKGGIVDIAVLNQMLVLAVNATLLVFSLKFESSPDGSKSVEEIKSNKTDQSSKLVGLKSNLVDIKKYNFEYIGDCTDVCNKCLELVTSYESNTYIVSIDVCDDSIFLGDLMTSVKLLNFRGNCLYESCRDFTTLWTSSLAAIDKFACLVADDSGNFSIFAKSKNPVNDHKSIKFETLGLFHHGETINKILKHSKNTTSQKNNLKIATNLGQKLHNCNRMFCCSNTDVNPEDFKLKEYSNLFSTMFTCCTSSGSFLQLCLFNDLKLFLKLSLLEQTLQLFHNDISVNFNKNYRNFENTHNTLPSKGFIDGDLIERFLKLPQALKLKVFETFKQNSGQMELECNTLESLVADIENIHNNRLI